MGKTFAVPDIHGRFDLLQGALVKIEAAADGGTVVFLGDYIDRGPQSKQVFGRLMAGRLMDGTGSASRATTRR
jgi:serine/threonine protein phosphatase 1